VEPTFDSSLCVRDGLCARVCPTGRLAQQNDEPPRRLVDLRCLDCGHCVAVCATGAMSQGDEKPLPNGWRLDAEKVNHLLMGRRSIRVFREDPLSRETIAAMIQAAQYAPSPHNTQPLAWTVISKPADIHRIAEATVTWMRQSIAAGSPMAVAFGMEKIVGDWERGIDGICRRAPHLIVAHAPATLPNGPHTAAIALTYLDLAAQPLGAGTCWAGFVFVGAGASPGVLAALALPAGQHCAGVVMAGHPAVEYRRIPKRNQPRIEWR